MEWLGRLLIDGGVANNTPISHALDLRARHVYVLPRGGPCELTAPPRGAVGMLIHATSLLVAFVGEAVTLTGSRVTILPPPCPIRVQPTDFAHAMELIDRAYEDTCAFLDRERTCGVALAGLPIFGVELLQEPGGFEGGGAVRKPLVANDLAVAERNDTRPVEHDFYAAHPSTNRAGLRPDHFGHPHRRPMRPARVEQSLRIGGPALIGVRPPPAERGS